MGHEIIDHQDADMRNPHTLFPETLEALEADELRNGWGDVVTEESSDSNYFHRPEVESPYDDIRTDYGTELGSRAISLNDDELEQTGKDEQE